MADIRLVQNTFFPQYSASVDYAMQSDMSLDERQALATAVIVALGTDRLAEPDDVLPDPDDPDRGGWWGDLDNAEIWGDGYDWPIGSRLWLLRRDKIEDVGSQRGATVTRVERYIVEALQPFVDLRIVSRLTVKAERVGRERIDALIRLYRESEVVIDLRYQVLWTEFEALENAS
jgi:phage gp46-like protein